jgi:hypothetical protein
LGWRGAAIKGPAPAPAVSYLSSAAMLTNRLCPRQTFFFTWNKFRRLNVLSPANYSRQRSIEEGKLGRGILLWLLGVPIPIIILIALLYH